MRPQALFLVILVLTAGVTVSVGQETFTLKRVFKQGETDRYTTVIKFEQNETEAVFSYTEVTREVKQDGGAVVATTVDTIVLRARGTEMPFPGGSGQVILSTYDASGKLVKQETVGGGSIGQLLNIARPAVYVQRPLKVGETVREEVPVGPDKSLKSVVTLTFVGIEKKGPELPEECFRYRIVTEAPVAGGGSGAKNRSDVTIRVSRETGKLVNAEGSMEGIPLPNGGTTKITYRVTRKQDDKK